MAVLILLENVPLSLAKRKSMLMRLLSQEEISCTIREARTKEDLDQIVLELQDNQATRDERILLICDVSLDRGVSSEIENMRPFLVHVWNKPSTDWWGRTHIIVFTASENDFDELSKLPKHPHRVVLSQIIFRGKDKNEDLKKAVRDWLHQRTP